MYYVFFSQIKTKFYALNSSKSSLFCRRRATEGVFPLEHVLCGRIFLSSQHLAPILSGRSVEYCSLLNRCHVQINQLHTFCCHWSQALHPPPPVLTGSLKSYGIAGGALACLQAFSFLLPNKQMWLHMSLQRLHLLKYQGVLPVAGSTVVLTVDYQNMMEATY